MSICECICYWCTHSSTQIFASFVDRDMVMLHFGSGIGHVNSAACRQSDEQDDSGSESEDSHSLCQASVSIAENMDISEAVDEDNSDLESNSSSESDAPTTNSSGLDSDGLSDSDDGYASF